MTSTSVINELYKLLAADPELKSLMSGNIYKLNRPNNSAKRDIVINAITNDNNDVQQGVYNINAFAKNLVIKVAGSDDNSQPDFEYFDNIGNVIKDTFTTFIPPNTRKKYTYIQNVGRFELAKETVLPDADNQHYYNFRINYYSPNL